MFGMTEEQVQPEERIQDAFATIIADALTYLIDRNSNNCDAVVPSSSLPTMALPELFVCTNPAGANNIAPLKWYVLRWVQYSRVSMPSYALALHYLDRLASDMHYQVTWNTIHKLLAVSLLLASKFLEDRCYSNSWFARVAGVSVESLNQLELAFLCIIGFNLRASEEDLRPYITSIEAVINNLC